MKPPKSTNKKTLSVSLLLPFTAFVLLILLVYSLPYITYDVPITQLVQSKSSFAFSFFMTFISLLGNSPYIEVLILASALALFLKNKKLESLLILTFPAIGAGVGSLFKNLINRSRPDPNLVSVLLDLRDQSFPSLHVLVFTIFFGYLLYLALTLAKNWYFKMFLSLISISLLLSISLSRIYLGVHWTSDVLGGYLFGSIFLYFVIKIDRKLNQPKTHAQR